jgi:hypothetical protein
VRFLEDGADIPDDLIRAVRDGGATFLCGAGVSRRIGLPSFEELTTRVYARLGETPDDEPAERIAIAERQFDRALRSLEKRTHRQGTTSRVRNAVVEILAAPNVAFSEHAALLALSRNVEGRPRLLTTNFDTIFEHAAHTAGMRDVPSHAGRSLPRPGGDSDFGILHLHGRIDDNMLRLSRTDLVLTSADFGDAYLRAGWASREIEERMRLTTLVLVGYAAEDPAMRLLLETLDADRLRFSDLKNIYAIEKAAPNSAALWKAKGIMAVEFTGYDPLYATILEWARYATKPFEYGRDRIRAILTDTTAARHD